MSQILRTRSADLVNHSTLRKWDVAIIGVGAIGSNLAYLLAKMGVGALYLFDDDYVEDVNIEPQIYHQSDVGLPKVDACELHCRRAAPDISIYSILRRVYDGAAIEHNIVVSCVDSIESRKDIAMSLGKSGMWEHFIDGRMGGNIVELYHATPHTLRSYWRDLAGVEPLEIPCSGRAVAYNGMFLASMIARQIAALSMGQPILHHIHVDLLAWSFIGALQQQPDVV